jgi:cell wall-associated NlpC family hydrolase
MKTLAEAALRFRGTPFRHQGRRPGLGLDCAGVVVCAAKIVGIDVEDVRSYRRCPHRALLRKYMDRAFVRVTGETQTGDVLLFWMHRPGLEIHCGIASPHGFVHVEDNKRVQEIPLSGRWRNQIAEVYRARGDS